MSGFSQRVSFSVWCCISWSKQPWSIKAQLKTWKTQIKSQQSLRLYLYFVYWWYLLNKCRWFGLSLYSWGGLFLALDQEGWGWWKQQTHLVNCEAAPPSAVLIRQVAAEPHLQGGRFLFIFFDPQRLAKSGFSGGAAASSCKRGSWRAPCLLILTWLKRRLWQRIVKFVWIWMWLANELLL